MNDSFFSYVQLLEVLAFFSGYPIVYALISVIKGNKRNSGIRNTLFILLPFAYAVVGLLYLGLQLKKFYPHYTLEYIRSEIQIPFLTIWGLLSVLFFIPIFSKKPFISLLHSLVFFYVIVRNFYWQLTSSTPENDVIKNYLRVYSDSIILNVLALFSLLFIYWLINTIRKKRKSAITN